MARNSQCQVRFLAELTLSTQSQILRYAQDDSEGLGMTAHQESLRLKNKKTYPRLD